MVWEGGGASDDAGGAGDGSGVCMWRSSVRARALYKGAECHGCARAGDGGRAGPERKFSIKLKLGRVAGGAELGGGGCRGVRAPVSAGEPRWRHMERS